MKYQVLRQHFGDKQYMAGAEREVKNKSDADQLIKMGLIAEIEEKAAPKAQNKMAKKTANKAE